MNIPEDQNVHHLLCQAVLSQNKEKVHLLLTEGARGDVIPPGGDIAALHLAAGLPDEPLAEEITRLCLQFSSDPNVLSSDGLTPLHISCIWGNVTVASLLLRNGSSVDAKDEDDNTAFDFAQQNDHTAVCALLSDWLKAPETVDEYSSPKYNLKFKRVVSIPCDEIASLHSSEPHGDSQQQHCDKHYTEQESDFLSQLRELFTNEGTTVVDHTDLSKLNDIKELDNESVSKEVLVEKFLTSLCVVDDDFSDVSSVKSHDKDRFCTFVVSKSNLSQWKLEDNCMQLSPPLMDGLSNGDQNLFVKSGKFNSFPRRKKKFDFPDVDSVPSVEGSQCGIKWEYGSVASQNTQTTEVLEYEYTDDEHGVKLIERHCPTTQSIEGTNDLRSSTSSATVIYDWKTYNSAADSASVCSSQVSIPDSVSKLQSSELRDVLLKLGDDPGPVTLTTKRVYQRRLVKLRKGLVAISEKVEFVQYPLELSRALSDLSSMNSEKLAQLEVAMSSSFLQQRPWREGTEKTAFNYVLLDPRVCRSTSVSDPDCFRNFIAAIFYIGKGKRSRPYSHLYEAIHNMKGGKQKTSAKVSHILDIWSSGLGVVSLHVFQSIIPAEAYTREACMIDAVGIKNLTNVKRGDFYGVASTWNISDKRNLGVHLLYKAMNILLFEGERQLHPADL